MKISKQSSFSCLRSTSFFVNDIFKLKKTFEKETTTTSTTLVYHMEFRTRKARARENNCNRLVRELSSLMLREPGTTRMKCSNFKQIDLN